MRNLILTTFFVFLATMFVGAQEQRTITGTIVDDSGQSLPGVTVLVVGTGRGTVTDIDGNYKLSISDGQEISVSFVGFKNQVIPVNSQTTIDVVLEEEAEQLEEVVVTAMGISRSAKSLTYARQSVDTEDMQQARTSNFLQGLSGKAAGVQVTNAMTNTGSNRVTIRGNSSLLGNNSPIYVVDGVVMDQTVGDQQSGSWGGQDSYVPVDYGDPMSNINPNDIASIEVLKGGNATALYGSRASNGVILVTTKKGSSRDGLGISVSSNTMFQSVMQWPDYQYAYGTGNQGVISTSAQNYDAETGLPINVANSAFGSPLLGQFNVVAPNGEIRPYAADFNNIRDMFQTGSTFTNSISIDKASDVGTMRIGYTNTSGEWVIPGMDEIQRHNFTLRATRNISDRLSVDASLMYVNEKVTNRVVENGSTQNPVHSFIFQAPDMGKNELVPWKTDEGYENLPEGPAGPFRNPYWSINENENEDRTNRLVGKWQFGYKILPGLQAMARIGNDYRSISGYKYDELRGPIVRGDKDGNYLSWERNIQNWNYDGILTYNKSFLESGIQLDATVGVRQNEYLFSNRQTVVQQMLLPDFQSVFNNAGVAESSEGDAEWTLNSVYAYVNVGFKGIAYVNGTLTREWSSTLSEGNNDYAYPSVGASLIFTELMPQNNILSYGKLRASYGITGQGTNAYQVTPDYVYVGNYQGNYPYIRPNQSLNNPNLRNEETEDMEFGLETSLFGSRVTANVTYYERESYDQIVPGAVAPATGYNAIVANAGRIRNKGWEVFLSAEALRIPLGGKPFTWNVDVNWARNENRVIHLDGIDPSGNPFAFESFSINSWSFASVQVRPGELYGNIVSTTIARDDEGRPLIDESGLPVEDPNQILGNYVPDWLGGIRNSFSWNGISVRVLLDIKMGGELLAMTHGRATQYGTSRTSLEGREEWLMSSRILGENNNERAGIGLEDTEYNRGDRKQGAYFDGVKYTEFDPGNTGGGVFVTSGEPNDVYISPNQFSFLHWRNHWLSTYDASYVKLRELIVGYDLPQSVLANTPFKSVNVSLVGRNLWNIFQNTPQGIDPEANSTSGNGQGLEYASFFPSRSYGFNVNLKF